MNENDVVTGKLPAAPQAPAARGRGRPRLHATAAERQRAYRARLRARGLRVVSTIVRDVRDGSPLHSDVLDLSQVRRW